MQTKAVLRLHLIPVRMAKIKETITKSGEDVGNPHSVLAGLQTGAATK